MPNAKVTIVDQNKGTTFETQTNETGNYTKGQLIPGSYTVTVEGAGFAKGVSKDVVVNVDAAPRVDIALTVGDVTQTVEVTSAAPVLQADRADVATTFSTTQLETIPNVNRNFQSFQLLTPGVSELGWQHASSENPQGSVQLNVNGQNFSATGYLLDGTEDQSPILGIIAINPNLDSLSEAKYAKQDYDAEFGYVGAGMAIASTKSGTNAFHGSAFDYLRLNSPGFADYARNPFVSSENNGAPHETRNTFGGSIGGKIIKDKLFFFADAELIRERLGSTGLSTVPTVGARTGDFSAYLGAVVAGQTVQTTQGNTVPVQQNMIFDPTTGDPLTGAGRQAFQSPSGQLNVIPASRLSPQALALLSYYPLPNAPGNLGQTYANNYAGSGTYALDKNQWDTRIDYFQSDKGSFFGRYSYAKFNVSAPGVFGLLAGGTALDNTNFAGVSDVLDQSISAGYTRTFSPTLVGDFRFGYLRIAQKVGNPDVGQALATKAGIPGLNLDNFYTSGLPEIDIQGGTNESSIGYALTNNTHCNCPLTEQEQQYQLVGNLTKTNGNHTFKVGTDLRYALNLRVPSDSHRAGELGFNGNYTGFTPSGSTGSSAQQGLGFATFLLGDVTSFGRYVSSSVDARERQKRNFFYGQDEWRITPKLLMTVGLRWELVWPETVNKAGNGAQLNAATGNIEVFGVGYNNLHGIQRVELGNFAPRFGITYQLSPKTVVRAGYGWSYELGTFGSTFGHNVTQNIPVLANQSISQGSGVNGFGNSGGNTSFNSVFNLAQGPPGPAPFTINQTTGTIPLPDGINGKVRPSTTVLGRVMAYNVTVQHQLTKDFTVSAAYVGNDGRHVFFGNGPNYNLNQAGFIAGAPYCGNGVTGTCNPTNQNLRKPFYAKYGWTQNIDAYLNYGNDNYRSLQVTAEQRFAHGYTLQANYTYQVVLGYHGDSYGVLYNRSLDYGNQDFFPHNQLVIAQNYEIPFGKGRQFGGDVNRAFDILLGGWNLNGTTVFYSGRPFTPSFGSAAVSARPDVGPNGRPNVGSGNPYASNQSRNGWLNVQTSLSSGPFIDPGAYNFGNYPVDSLYGPIFINQDMSLAKKFQITENRNIEFRGEAYNIFNHTNLGDPNSNVTGNGAGVISSLAPNYLMRRLQFALRLNF